MDCSCQYHNDMKERLNKLRYVANNIIQEYHNHGYSAKIFGSVARGVIHDQSDIDIVIMDHVSPEQYKECLSIIAMHDDMPCDLIIFDEIQSEYLKNNILAHGVDYFE